MKKMLLVISICLFVVSGWTQNGTEPIKITDMLKVKSIGNVALNNDASKAIFTVTGIEPDGDTKWEYKYVTQIWMAATDGSSKPRQLTAAKESATQPVWSPDDKQLAFVRNVDSKPQIFLMNFDGGEPIQLTKYKYGASNPKWINGGNQIIFSANIGLKDMLADTSVNAAKTLPNWPFEKPGFEANANLQPNTAMADPDGNIQQVRAYLENNEKDKKAKVIDKLIFQEEAITSSDMNFAQVFMVDAVPGAIPKPITKGFYNFNNAECMAASNKLMVVTNINDAEHPDRDQSNEIYSVNTDGSGMQKVLGKKDYNYNNISASPTGKWLALQHGPVSFVSIPTLALLPAGGTEASMINIPVDRNCNSISWASDDVFYFNTPSNGGTILCRYDIKKKAVEKLTAIDEGISSFAIKNNKLVYIKTSVTDPFELYVADVDAKSEKPLTSFNSEWLQTKQLSIPEKHSFKNEKGLAVEYWVMKPFNYQMGKKYPAVLEIHGGPTAMWGPGESSMWHEFQYFCSKGYVVVYGNPRGSGGYGLDYLRANVNDWGKGPTSDVLTSLDKTVAEGFIDTANLFVTGGSYAGYLVAWIVGHDKRFKAACSQRGVYDVGTFFGEGNAWRLVPNYFGGYPWEEKTKAVIERESPINYVQNITTPYIIFHGENDLRTGVIQGEQLYKSLKVLNRPVEYVRHPGATHEITRSGNNRQRIDQMLRTWEFFERYRK